jgi:hypothetical protein
MPPPDLKYHPPENGQYHSQVSSRRCTPKELTEIETRNTAKWPAEIYQEIANHAYRKVFLEEHKPYDWNGPSLRKVEKLGLKEEQKSEDE